MQLSYRAKVKLLKFTLISIMVLVVLSFLVIPIIYLNLRTKGYIFASNILTGLLKNDIKPPVISGTTQQGGAYYLSAQKITNNFLDFNIKKDTHAIAVSKPTLVYNTNKKGLIFFITSQEAIIDPSTHLINIPGTITINSNQGYEGTLHNLLINIKEDSGKSNDPVSGYFNNKILNAKGIEIQQGGALVIFKGEVVILTKYP